MCRFSIQKEDLFWRFFGSYSPKNSSMLPSFSLELGLWPTKALFWNIWSSQVFIGKNGTEASTLGPTLTPRSPVKMTEKEKISSSEEKLQSLGYPRMPVQGFISCPLSKKEMRLLFGMLGLFLPRNRAGSQVKNLKSKFDKTYFIHATFG